MQECGYSCYETECYRCVLEQAHLSGLLNRRRNNNLQRNGVSCDWLIGWCFILLLQSCQLSTLLLLGLGLQISADLVMDVAFFEPFDQCNLNIGPGESRAADAAQPAGCHCFHPMKAFIGVIEPDEVETVDIIFGAMTEHGAQTPVEILIE